MEHDELPLCMIQANGRHRGDAGTFADFGGCTQAHKGVVADACQVGRFLPERILEMSPRERWCRHALHGGKGHLFIGNVWFVRRTDAQVG